MCVPSGREAEDVETVGADTVAAAEGQLSRQGFDCIVMDPDSLGQPGILLLQHVSESREPRPWIVSFRGSPLLADQEQALRRASNAVVFKGQRSHERLLDEVTRWLHLADSELSVTQREMLRDSRYHDPSFEGRRILVVEDDVRNIFAISSVLEPLGVCIEIARNGREALLRLQQTPAIDLVLMDIMMPVMDGLSATIEIRKNPQHATLPILALTAKAMADDRAQCLAAGMNDYLAKPVEIERLLSAIRVWMPK